MKRIMLKKGENPLTMDIHLGGVDWMLILLIGVILFATGACGGIVYYAYTVVGS